MASSAAKLSLFLLLAAVLSSLHTDARESQFFNKIPSTTNNAVVPNNQQEPDFLPENERSYGLYSQNPPSTTTSDHKYLPKNYNPVAYVTQPEDVNESTAFTEESSFTTNPDNNNKNYDNSNSNSNNQQQQEEGEAEFRNYPTTVDNGNTNTNTNYYYNGGSSFNSQPQGQSNGFQPQGMSDTRIMANGKYFYDVNSERYSSNHPYETLRAQNEFNSRNFYDNNGANANEFNNRNFYGNSGNEFTAEEENMP